MKLVLASKSPRRRELMALITPDFEAVCSDSDESGLETLSPEELCTQLARRKCFAVASGYPDGCVIGCDTVVYKYGEVLGKPRSKGDALRMLRLLSGSGHTVYTGVCVSLAGKAHEFCCRTGVRFFPIPEDELLRYADSDEPYDKAGGYAIQGGMARFIESIDGDYFNVMGLPVSRLYAELRRLHVV